MMLGFPFVSNRLFVFLLNILNKHHGLIAGRDLTWVSSTVHFHLLVEALGALILFMALIHLKTLDISDMIKAQI